MTLNKWWVDLGPNKNNCLCPDCGPNLRDTLLQAHAERVELRTAAQDVINSWDHNGPDGIVSATRIERLRAALALGDKEV